MFKLVIADDEGTKTVVPLVRDEISIGRKEGNTIRLTERNISRNHVQLRRSNGGFVLRDLGSYNGVLINGQRVEGEAALKAGDQIKLGDYLMAVESDQPVAEAPPAPAVAPAAAPAPTKVSPVPPAPAPVAHVTAEGARLVMLAGPAVGAEFKVPAQGRVRIGRGSELEIAIDHRSVSREHAELRIGADGTHVSDLGSSNGVRVNGAADLTQALHGGDVIELGQVALRYVAPGEPYVFDPADAVPFAKAGGASSLNWALLGAGAVGIAAIAYFAFGTTTAEPATIATPLEPAPRVSAVPAAPSAEELAPVAAGAEATAPADPFDGALAACRDAVSGERFAEAVAHATSALKARPDDPQATECMTVANAGHRDEQTYVRGKAAFQAGDARAALAEFSRLAADSPFAGRPEVAEAQQAVDAAARAASAAAALAPAPRAAPTRSGAARSGPARSTPRPAPASAPAAEPAAAPLPSGQTPFQVASACLARGDNQCVIRALTGKAHTAQELGLLIETHRSLGNTDKAVAGMEQYLKQFPSGPKAATYRRMLDRQGQ